MTLMMKPHQETLAMYNMYPWDQPADASDEASEAVHAVQVALDRRDNGGDANTYDGL
jgi:hypothetical protein